MLLKRGITGSFDNFPADNASEKTDLKNFRRICYSICMQSSESDAVCAPDNASYYYARLVFGGNDIYILLNRYYPVIAFSHGIEMNNKTFFDNAKLSVQATPQGEILTA